MTAQDVVGLQPAIVHGKQTSTSGSLTERGTYLVPDIQIKELLDVIPVRCFKRSALWSFLYLFWDIFVILVSYKIAATLVSPDVVEFLHPSLYTIARVAVWVLYGFWVGLFGTGLWIIGHECGHQAFSTSKTLNNSVGWLLHSALGVPYHSWRISHSKHHASTSHCTQDQAYVPRTRSQMGLSAFDAQGEDMCSGSASDKVNHEIFEALDNAPLTSVVMSVLYLLVGWPAYLFFNASGQRKYPFGTNHFSPKSPIFSPNQLWQIIWSDIGMILWIGGLGTWMHCQGFAVVFRVYIVPYLWVNHWLILITFLQHTDPILPHYRTPEFSFVRGALSTLDRELMGGCGSVMKWIGAHATHGISETHIVHHLSSKIPHYHAWEAREAVNKKLHAMGFVTQGGPGGWAEVYRVMKQCRFVEDVGDVVFYKDAYGRAAMKPVFTKDSAGEIE